MMTGVAKCMSDLCTIVVKRRTEDVETDEISKSPIASTFEALGRNLNSSLRMLYIRLKAPEQTFHRSAAESIEAVIAPVNTSTEVAPLTTTEPVEPFWVLDSAASYCLTGDPSVLQCGLHCAELVLVATANGQPLCSELCGRATGRVNISGIRYFDGAKMNLISSGLLVRQGCEIRHTVLGVHILKGEVIVGSGRLMPNNLWLLDFLDESRLDGPVCTLCPRLEVARPLLLDGCAVVVDAVSASDADFAGAEHGIKEGKEKTSAAWVVATAAPHHATGNRDLLSGFIMEHDDEFVHAVDGIPRKVLARGAVITDSVVLPDVWYVPELAENLVSFSQLVELDYSVTFSRRECYIRSADGKDVGKGHLQEGGLYELAFLKVPLAI